MFNAKDAFLEIDCRLLISFWRRSSRKWSSVALSHLVFSVLSSLFLNLEFCRFQWFRLAIFSHITPYKDTLLLNVSRQKLTTLCLIGSLFQNPFQKNESSLAKKSVIPTYIVTKTGDVFQRFSGTKRFRKRRSSSTWPRSRTGSSSTSTAMTLSGKLRERDWIKVSCVHKPGRNSWRGWKGKAFVLNL